MSQKPESLFRARIRKILKPYEESGQIVILTQQQVALRGYPDLVFCVGGKFLAWELKKDEKSKATALQLHMIEKIRKSGGYATVVHPLNFQEELKLLLEQV
jgi:hypothetical protein